MNQGRILGFLVGAGVSIPCGAPTTAELTEALMAPGISYTRHTDGRYFPCGNCVAPVPSAGVPALTEIASFFRDLHPRVESYYADRVDPAGCTFRFVNYEDLAYLAVQVFEGINRERDNPALAPFVDELASRFGSHESLKTLADEAIRLITHHVTHHLHGLKPKPDHLACIRDACFELGELGTAAVPILSLNHDCLIETTLRHASIRVNDMLHDECGRRVLSISLASDQVNLLKLHGSINWCRWGPTPPRASDDRWDRWVGATTDEQLRRAWDCDDPPVILVGRFNKELAYAGAPFTDLFACARSALGKVGTLVVSGYSFGDKAVNTMIIDWIYGAPKGARRIVVAHNDPKSLRDGSRGAVSDKWEGWSAAGVLVEIPKFLGDLSWKELRGVLDV